MALPGQKLAHKAIELWIDRRLAATDGDNRCATIVRRGETLFDRQFVGDGRSIFADAAATGTRQITSMERLEHHDERELLDASQPLAGDVAGQARSQTQRKSHGSPFSPAVRAFPAPPRPSRDG